MERKHNAENVPFAKELRKNMTKEERHLWNDFLRDYPVRFSRQKVLGKYIVDFYSAEASLVIELDGSQHYESQIEYDARRTEFLQQYELQVIRVPNNAVMENFRGVCEYIDNAVKQSLSQRCALTAPFPQGSLKNSPQGEPMKTITIYTDGACSGNPGPGGWGAILEWRGHQKELSGGEAQTTNNRMELTAVLTALAILKEPCIVELYSDSKYVVDAIEKGWLYGWQKKGWIKADKKPVLNVDLWQQLLPLLARHDVRLHWVKGHAENEKNNRCDQLAVAESKKFR